MRCPVCNILLATADWKGVEVDYCPKCWGIWLDRGELNLIVRRSGGVEASDESLEVATASPRPTPIRPAPEPEVTAADPSFSWRATLSAH